MASKIKVDQIQTADGTGTIVLQNQLSGMTTASLPTLTGTEMPTGSIVQVVSTHSTANMTTTSGSMVGTGLIATITPSSSSNKILVTIAGGRTDVGHAHQPRASLRSSINGASYTEILTNIEERTYTGTAYWGDAHALTYLYSPNTTNSVAIQPYFMTNTSTHYYNTSSCSIGLTLMEIKG